MNNEQCYLDRMRVGMYDKCWFLANIDTDVDTIIDFGCADGSLFRFLETMYPDRFIYVGIENEQHFLDKCPHIPGRTSYFRSIYEVKNNIDWTKAILVMNSVCHEIYSYVDKTEVQCIIAYAGSKNIRHIAIRDMFFRTKYGIDANKWLEMDNAFAEKYPKQYADNKNVCGRGEGWRDWRELSLKYTYTENWDREVKEQYLHPMLLIDVEAGISCSNERYDMATQYFCIPQQIKRIERDLGVEWPKGTTTHVKIWISR